LRNSDSDFAGRILRIRNALNGTLRDSRLRDLLDELQELEDELPPRPERPQVPYSRSRRRKRSETRQSPQPEQPTRDWLAQAQHWQAIYGTRLQIINSVRADVRAPLSGHVAARSMPWKFLPPSELTEGTIIVHVREFQRRHQDLQVDERRLREAFRLCPDEVYVGQNDFDGYFAFCFERERCVLLDHPVVGNAAYVFGSDWRILARLSKRELLDSHSGRFIRIVHRTNWQSQIRAALMQVRRGPVPGRNV
jgi:hypothetical protein